MGINDRCAVGTCKNARKYKEKYVIKPHISAYNNSLELKFWRCSDPKLYPKWTTACNRKNFKFGKNNFICSNHFKYGKPTLVSPNPTLVFEGIYGNINSNKAKSPYYKKRFCYTTIETPEIWNQPKTKIKRELIHLFLFLPVEVDLLLIILLIVAWNFQLIL